MKTEIEFKLLQPWSTFVMETQLPPSILEKMIRISDEIVENRESDSHLINAGQTNNQFFIEHEILEQEEVMHYFLDVCKTYVVEAFCQSRPADKENILKEEWWTRLDSIWINSQKDNEYFPIHFHQDCAISAVMYLKIPEFLPSRQSYKNEEDGSIIFTNNSSTDHIWGRSNMILNPQLGGFFIFPALLQHQVYPFRTPDGKGERRSVSFNAHFLCKSEQEAI